MSKNPFELKPYPGLPHPDLKVTVEVSLEATLLKLTYRIQGPELSSLKVPAKTASSPQRKDLLWKNTCLEAFLARADQPQYEEINLSPSGDWSCYLFDDYRTGHQVDSQVTEIKSNWIEIPAKNSAELHTSFDISTLTLLKNAGNTKTLPLLLGLTAVLELKNSDLSYWAIQHCGEKPDFHLRTSFTQVLASILS